MSLSHEQRKAIREAVSEDAKKKAKRAPRVKQPASVVKGKIVRHGTYAAARAGCTCEECLTAQRQYYASHRRVRCINYPECNNMVWYHSKRSGRCRSCASKVANTSK